VFNTSNTNTPLFTCLSGGTLEISAMSFKKGESGDFSSSLIIIESGGFLFLFFHFIYHGICI
jgi:hypothetical protein